MTDASAGFIRRLSLPLDASKRSSRLALLHVFWTWTLWISNSASNLSVIQLLPTLDKHRSAAVTDVSGFTPA
jgi:hypothetical protein